MGIPCRLLEAASPPGGPAGGVCAASGPRGFEGSGSCLPLSLPNRVAARGQGAQRRHQPARATGAAGAHGTPARASGRAGGAGAAHQHKRRGKARAPPATTCAQRAQGPGANPLSPQIKYRIGRPLGRDGEKRGRRAVRAAGGKRGEPPRGRAPDAAGATGAAGTGKQGAGRSARPPAGTRAALINRTDARAQNYAAGASGARKPPER